MTKVELNDYSKDVIDFYIKNYKPFDKAGSYGIQDWFSSQVKKIDGCYYNVMGLPLSKVFKCLYDLSMNNLDS
jgi:septum formation protein